MNDNPSAVKAMKENFDALNQSATANEKMDYALMTNNIHDWKNAKHDHFFSYVYSRAKAGFYEDVISDINAIRQIPLAEFAQTFGYANQDLTTEELEQRRDKVIEKALDRAAEIRKAEDIVGSNFSRFSEEIQEIMAHQASVAKDVDARTESVRKRLTQAGADLSALEDQQTEEAQLINEYRTIAEEEGVTNKVEALVREYIGQGSDIITAYKKAFEKLYSSNDMALLSPESATAGQQVKEPGFSEASLRYQIYDTATQIKNLEEKLKLLKEQNAGENYTQDRQNQIDELTSQFNELSRRQGRAKKL